MPGSGLHRVTRRPEFRRAVGTYLFHVDAVRAFCAEGSYTVRVVASTDPDASRTDQQLDSQALFFASQRERRLWTWTFVVVAGIYSTLGLAATLADFMYNQGLSAIVFVTCMLLIGLTILTQGLKTRPGGVEIGVGLGITVVYVLVFFRCTMPERSHLMEYGVVAVFIHEALMERKSHGRHVRVPALLAVLATSLVGTIDEVIQIVLPSRVFDWNDVLFNVLAGVMAVMAMMILGWARSRPSTWCGKS